MARRHTVGIGPKWLDVHLSAAMAICLLIASHTFDMEGKTAAIEVINTETQTLPY